MFWLVHDRTPTGIGPLHLFDFPVCSTMHTRAADTTYWFDQLPSYYEPETRELERAIASNCHTLRHYVPAYRESLAFRRQPNSDKLRRALTYVGRRLPGASDEAISALHAPRNVSKIASLLVHWLGIFATPIAWVTEILGEDGTVVASGVPAVSAMYEIVGFGNDVVDARSDRDLEFAAQRLLRAATVLPADVVIAILLRKASVGVRRPTRGTSAASA